MDWINLLTQILEVCVIPLIGAATVYTCYFIKCKAAELKNNAKNDIEKKYIDMLKQTILDCVNATNQTYVNTLKKEGAFSEEAQKKAFFQTYDAVMKILSDDAKEYLNTAIGDLKSYVTNKIESEVLYLKDM